MQTGATFFYTNSKKSPPKFRQRFPAMQITGLHILEVFDSRVQLFELIAGDGQLFALLLDELSPGLCS